MRCAGYRVEDCYIDMLLRSGIDSMLRKIANVDGCALDMPQRCETCRVLPPIPHDDRRSKLDMGFALAVTMQLEGVKTRLHADTPRVHVASGRLQLNDADMLYTIEVDYLSPPFSRSAEPERSTQIMPMRGKSSKTPVLPTLTFATRYTTLKILGVPIAQSSPPRRS
jgi:hypothetical protein